MAGAVRIGGEPARKPGQMVTGHEEFSVDSGPEYVSRGGVKLANALDAFGLDVEGRQALDVGASTGGFTDVLLQRGAASVVALDVAYGELHWRLRQDPRVTVLERTNARSLEPEALPYRPNLIVADVSFISLKKVLPAVLAAAAPRFDCLAMVKPQFEAGRGAVGAGGVVREPQHRADAVRRVADAAWALGLGVRGVTASSLPGPAGNVEYFLWLTRQAAPLENAGLDRAIAEGPQ